MQKNNGCQKKSAITLVLSVKCPVVSFNPFYSPFTDLWQQLADYFLGGRNYN
jgi:hypothetical protein